ncbi:MAG: hypothetical protein DI590_25265 [Methylorubrum populi]|nr:MAG: hypothetical protein DI590_25265 [Methylorubrum populi]
MTSSYPAGQPLVDTNESNACGSDTPITVRVLSSDRIAGQASVSMASSYAKLISHSNGNNFWTMA